MATDNNMWRRRCDDSDTESDESDESDEDMEKYLHTVYNLQLGLLAKYKESNEYCKLVV